MVRIYFAFWASSKRGTDFCVLSETFHPPKKNVGQSGAGWRIQRGEDWATGPAFSTRRDARDKLLIFLARRDVEPTNNGCERASGPAQERDGVRGRRSEWYPGAVVMAMALSSAQRKVMG